MNKEANRRWQKKYRDRIKREREELTGRTRPNACEVCKRTDSRIDWDHCHKENKFWGWLCMQCNLILGRVDDDPAILDLLVGYLESSASLIM